MSGWQGRSVLVTGCTGFLGGALTAALLERGAEVVGLVRDMVPRASFFADRLADRVNVVRGALEDADAVERAINDYAVDTVFHLAAQAIVGVANRNPASTFEANIKGTWVLLEACRRNPTVKTIVVASSDKAYGDHEALPYEEHFPLQGRHPYDVSKSCADLITLSYAHTYGLPVSITRCGNLFGPGDLNFNRIVPVSHDLDREHDALEKSYAALQDKLAVARVSVASARSAPPTIQVVDYAVTPDEQAAPQTKTLLFGAIAIGLLAGVALAVLLDQMRDTVTAARLARRRDLPPLYATVEQDRAFLARLFPSLQPRDQR